MLNASNTTRRARTLSSLRAKEDPRLPVFSILKMYHASWTLSVLNLTKFKRTVEGLSHKSQSQASGNSCCVALSLFLIATCLMPSNMPCLAHFGRERSEEGGATFQRSVRYQILRKCFHAPPLSSGISKGRNSHGQDFSSTSLL